MILRSHDQEAGLFSHLNFLMTHLEIRGNEGVHVDWTHGLPYSQPERGNLFEFLFHQISERRPNDAVVDTWPHHRYTGSHAWRLYVGDDSWRRVLNHCWRTLSVHPSILDEVEAIRASWPSDVIGIHVRNRNIRKECPSGRNPELEDFVHPLRGRSAAFLATDNIEAVGFFRELLGDRLLVRDIPRSKNMNTEFHLSEPQTFEDAKNCLVDALLLASCQEFIHSVSNIATAVLYMNPDLPQHLVLPEDDPGSVTAATTDARLIHVTHPRWQDWITLDGHGAFRRHSQPGEAGRWKPLTECRIQLTWEKWPAEVIELKPESYRFGSARNRVNGINSLCYCLASG